MARGFGSGGTTSVLGYSNAPLGAGVRRGAELEAAQRSLASGGDVGEAVARTINAGGGELRLSGDQLPEALRLRRQEGPMLTENGAVMLDLRSLMSSGGGEAGLKGNIVAFGLDGKEIKTDRTVTVTVVENGIAAIKVADSMFRFQPQRQKVEITKEQRDAILTANLPPQMKGLRFNQSGQINGYKLDPEKFDKATRAALYKQTGSDGVLRFAPGSFVAKALENQLPAGGRVNPVKLSDFVTVKG